MPTTDFAYARSEFEFPIEHIGFRQADRHVSHSFLYTRRKLWNAAALLGGDALALTVALYAATGFRSLLDDSSTTPEWTWMILLAWTAGAAASRLLPSWGMGAVEELRRMVLMIVGIYSCIAVVLFFEKQAHEESRLILLGGLVISIPLVPLTRMFVKKLLVFTKIWGVPTAIYGDGDTSGRIVRALEENKGLGYVPIGIFNNHLHTFTREIEGVPVLGDTTQSTAHAPVAVLALPNIRRERLVELLDGPLASYKHVIIIPNLFEVQSLWVETRDLGGMLGLEISRNLLAPAAWLTKRIFEIAVVLAAAILWLPICVLVAIALWLENRASPFFLQDRVGIDGASFKTWKFRTMVLNAESVLLEKLEQDAELAREWRENFKLKNDPRITLIGKFLRRTSLDELPQLINVLFGEMSLVGPRPLPRYHHEKLNDQTKSLRERVRPGLTGLWQVSGRSDAGTLGMQRWDSYYVRNWSIWLDIVIIVRTIQVVVKGSGAY